MGSEEIEKAKLKALEAEAEKHLAEKDKLIKEKDEIDKKLNKSFFDVRLSTVIKTIIGGIVAGLLLWSVGIDYMFKTINVNLEVQRQLKNEKEGLESEMHHLEDEKQKVVDEKLQLKSENLRLAKELNEVKQLINEASEKSDTTAYKDAKKKLDKEIVAGMHRLEDQLSRISVAQTKTQTVEPTSSMQRTGWVYLGEYSDKVWKTRNFDFATNANPESLLGKTLNVYVHSVNVRTEKLSGDVVKVLMKGQSVMITNVKNYTFTDYYWAEVKY